MKHHNIAVVKPLIADSPYGNLTITMIYSTVLYHLCYYQHIIIIMYDTYSHELSRIITGTYVVPRILTFL